MIADVRARRASREAVLPALASYLDSGSIVAGSVGLAIWHEQFGFSSGTLGVIGAVSSNGFSAAAGAFVGGWLCDRHGRRVVYQWDLLLYAFGVAWIAAAVEPWMLIFGYVCTGLAVGADVPASWTLVAERAPERRHGPFGGVAQLFWGLGPLVVLLAGLALSSLGELGIRIIFAHLLVLSLVLWSLRRGLKESALWQRVPGALRANVRGLLSREYVRPLAFLVGMYGMWSLKAGTNGFFLPYILRTVGAQSQASSVLLQASNFLLGVLGSMFVFIRLIDRADPRRMLGASIALQTAATLLFALFPLTTAIAIGFVLLTGAGGGFGPQAFFQLWSAESFPTSLRATALGLMFGIVRIGIGAWSLFVPTLIDAGFTTLAWLMTAFLVTSGLIGVTFGPRNTGRSLTELHP